LQKVPIAGDLCQVPNWLPPAPFADHIGRKDVVGDRGGEAGQDASEDASEDGPEEEQGLEGVAGAIVGQLNGFGDVIGEVIGVLVDEVGESLEIVGGEGFGITGRFEGVEVFPGGAGVARAEFVIEV
jgi:hypothetical protein